MLTAEQSAARIDIPNPATRNINLVAKELAVLGHVTPELKAMVLDEELTHAAEVLASQEMAYAAIPRTYYQRGYDIIDIHNQSLKRVFNDGIKHSEREVSLGVPGADWELERRKAEFENLKTITAMPPGTVCVEISANPFDKPEHEQLAQHYNGLTMIRASIKSEKGIITQYNYAASVSNPEFLLAIQQKLGRRPEESTINSQELLKNPIFGKVEGPEQANREVDSIVGAALLESSIGHSALRMIQRVVERRREAWEFVTSDVHSDIHEELLDKIQLAAYLNPALREKEMAAIRSGLWKELKDQFNGRNYSAQVGGVLATAATRAVEAGDVFIACGSTVVATEFNTAGTVGEASSRAETVKSLREKVVGSGKCTACGASGKLYGCGLCDGCNKSWCDIYASTGKQTEIKNLAFLGYARKPNSQQGFFERLSADLQRYDEEIRLKRELERQKQELKQEQELQRAA